MLLPLDTLEASLGKLSQPPVNYTMKLAASSNNLLLRYNNKPVIPPVAGRYLGSPVHPIRPKIAHLYENRDRNTLWWRVSVSQLTHLKRVVRSWCARRARIAFQQALKQQGFDRLGVPIPSLPCAQDERLTGSLDIIIRPPCVKQSFETVQQDTHRLLGSILSQRAMHLERTAENLNGSSESRRSSEPS